MSDHKNNPLSYLKEKLARLERRGLRRTVSLRDGPQECTIEIGGQRLINFGSNDYLGLASDERLARAVIEVAGQANWGSGASPLVTGRGRWHERLERRLAQFEGSEAALLFSSGFAANVGTIAALVKQGDAIYSDEKNHASIIDGCRLSRAEVHTYRHVDCEHLEELLRSSGQFRRRLIVTDTLFSMDGDLAPLRRIAKLATRYDAILMVDEAHATGVLGKHGRGLAEAAGVEDRVDVCVGTLSKALGCHGGFVSGSRTLIEWLLNRARSYVFSTAQPEALCAAAIAAIDVVEQEPNRRVLLARRSKTVRERLAAAGWNTGNSASQIIPLIVGEPERAMQLAAALRAQGILVPGIRPPTVPPGESLLRISLASSHTDEMIDTLVEQLTRLA